MGLTVSMQKDDVFLWASRECDGLIVWGNVSLNAFNLKWAKFLDRLSGGSVLRPDNHRLTEFGRGLSTSRWMPWTESESAGVAWQIEPPVGKLQHVLFLSNPNNGKCCDDAPLRERLTHGLEEMSQGCRRIAFNGVPAPGATKGPGHDERVRLIVEIIRDWEGDAATTGKLEQVDLVNLNDSFVRHRNLVEA